MTPVREHEPSTDSLVRRARAGDEAAWKEIIARHSAALAQIGRAYRLSAEERADAVQETWLRAVLYLSALRESDRLAGWLCTIMRRSCLTALARRRQRREHLVGDHATLDTVDEAADVERHAVSTEWTAILRQASAGLTSRERQLVRELAADDPSYDQLAHRLRMPRGSIGPTRMRALRRLRAILEESHGIRSAA